MFLRGMQVVRDEAGEGAAGGGSATPVSSPPVETSQPEVDSSEFEALASFEPEAEPEPVVEPTQPTVRPTQPAAPVKPEVPVAAAPASLVAVQLPAATTPIQPQAAAQPQPTPSPTARPQGPTTEQVAAMRQEAFNRIQTTYGFTEEEKNMLAVEPERVLPSLAAKLHLNIFDTVYTAIMQNLGPVIDARMGTYSAQADHEKQFFSMWPELRDEKYKGEVLRIANAYNRMFPQSDPGKWVREVGTMAMVSLGIQRAAQPQAASAPPQPPATPQPFTPANPHGAATGSPARPADGGNEWVKMISEWEEVERRN